MLQHPVKFAQMGLLCQFWQNLRVYRVQIWDSPCPLKFKAIINLPSPSLLHQLQSQQGKANFLQCFIPNYDEVAKGFTRLLKQGIPFCWDEIAQKSFDAYCLSLLLCSALQIIIVIFPFTQLLISARFPWFWYKTMIMVMRMSFNISFVTFSILKRDMHMSKSWHWLLSKLFNVFVTIFCCVQ